MCVTGKSGCSCLSTDRDQRFNGCSPGFDLLSSNISPSSHCDLWPAASQYIRAFVSCQMLHDVTDARPDDGGTDSVIKFRSSDCACRTSAWKCLSSQQKKSRSAHTVDQRTVVCSRVFLVKFSEGHKRKRKFTPGNCEHRDWRTFFVDHQVFNTSTPRRCGNMWLQSLPIQRRKLFWFFTKQKGISEAVTSICIGSVGGFDHCRPAVSHSARQVGSCNVSLSFPLPT